MKRFPFLLLVLVAATLFFLAERRTRAQTSSPFFPVALSVPIAPMPFQSDGKINLVYELHLDSFRAGELTLNKLEVLDNKKALAIYQGTELDGLLARPGTNQLNEKRLIGPGMRVGHAHYALYAHLQPGSIKVKPGERVKRGQVTRQNRNSGNAVGPHLHFHLPTRRNCSKEKGYPT